ncbi:unnamed protein product [Brachionus calyciflorus]|uniref:Uncharacterized protein n=1 Tax=Brachionus calyciflorus TaxID=104777 RepID=A0A813US13_9BILA|nr:unnamed protein product [Brachionus calyciflorus]
MGSRLIASLITLFIIPNVALAYNCTSSELSIPVSTGYWRVVFIFNCYPITLPNQLFPISFSSQSSKYNEIDLSPNVYTNIPITQLCPFKYLTHLDLSFNSIQTTANSFRDLSCLTGLKTLNLANNKISSPLMTSDFDDTLSAQLTSLNLTNNFIPYLESRVFIKSDGSSRFPNLEYLGLAYNGLKDFDLLWPLTLPQSNLLIDMKYNNISNLVNQMNLTFNNVIFKYPMIGNRYLDLTTNSLQGFDDYNLLQYGLHNEWHLKEFLFKISNYDLRQANLVRTFICFCPSFGQLTLFWFKLISSDFDRTSPIFQIYCSNTGVMTYVLDYPCGPTTKYTGPSTTTYSTLQPFNYKTTTNSPVTTLQALTANNSNISIVGIGNQLAETTSRSNSTITTSTINNDYFFLFFLFIPFFFILCLIFICCIGRWCQLRTNSMCSFICCPCFRPYDELIFGLKEYDATFCFNQSDENWLDEDLITPLTHQQNNFKIHKLSVPSRSGEKQNKEIENYLRKSKRIVLIFTQSFIKEDFRNKFFTNFLRNMKDDVNCVIIAINKDLDRQTFANYVKYLNSPYDPVNPRYRSRRSIFAVLKSRIKYNCGLREVEKLDINSRHFWRDFLYVMPFIHYNSNEPKVITESKKIPRLKSRNLNNNDSGLSYASEAKNQKSYRHVIIPIPDFMRTTLGGYKKEKSIDITEPARDRYNFQESQRNLFSSISQNSVLNTTPNSTRSLREERREIRRDISPLKNQRDLIQDRNIEVVNKRERSDSTDILALFAPGPNTVYPFEKKVKKLSKSRSKSIEDENSN